MPDPATLPPAVSALERRLGFPEGSLEDEDRARAEDALSDATELALDEVSETKATAWRGECPGSVFVVILKAARREFENPRGLNQEALSDHSVGISETSGVYLTDREIVTIRRAASGRRGAARLASIYVIPATGDPREVTNP